MFNEIIYDNIQLPNDTLYIKMAGKLFPDSNYCITRTKSLTNVIMYVEKGRMELDIENSHYTIQAGDTVIIPQQLTYTIKSNLIDLPTCLWINIRGSLFYNAYKMFFNNKPCIICQYDCLDYIEQINSLITKTDSDMSITQNILSILNGVFYSTKHKTPKTNFSLKNYYDKFICDNIYNFFSIENMATYFNESIDTLTNNFKKFFNTTPYKYYNNIRLQIAYSLLVNTKISIDKISYDLKFSSRNYFSLVFKKHFNLSPAQCRKMHR